MDFTARRSTQIVIAALFSVVVTQLIYVALSSAGADINRMVIWTTEAVAFLAMSLFGLILLVQSNSNGAACRSVGRDFQRNSGRHGSGNVRSVNGCR